MIVRNDLPTTPSVVWMGAKLADEVDDFAIVVIECIRSSRRGRLRTSLLSEGLSEHSAKRVQRHQILTRSARPSPCCRVSSPAGFSLPPAMKRVDTIDAAPVLT